MKRKKGFYSISVVAKMFSVHQQTVRMYEKEGLISPRRTEGNTRLFSEEDVDRLEEVIYLTHKMGVNLAGVQMILKLQKKIKRLQSDVNKQFVELGEQLEKESEEYKKQIKTHGSKLIEMKQDKDIKDAKQRPIDVGGVDASEDDDSALVDDWEIDYDQD